MKKTLFGLVLLASVASSAPPPTPTPGPPRRFRIADLDRKGPPVARQPWIQSVENFLPISLAIFLGIRAGNHVQYRGRVIGRGVRIEASGSSVTAGSK